MGEDALSSREADTKLPETAVNDCPIFIQNLIFKIMLGLLFNNILRRYLLLTHDSSSKLNADLCSYNLPLSETYMFT